MNFHDSDITILSASALYDFCTFHTKVIQCHRRRSCDFTIMNIHAQSSLAPMLTDRDYREQELNYTVQCWNERGCKRDENALFLLFLRT